MSVLLVLLMCLIILAISYLRGSEENPLTAAQARAPGSPLVPDSPLEIPAGHCFHPCHTWLAKEGGENARVGIDSFATSLFGEIDHIEVTKPNRWVRQGQRLMTVSIAGVLVELVSPVEGTVKELNEIALRDPALVVSDPYRGGWIALAEVVGHHHQSKESSPGANGEAMVAEQPCTSERNGFAALTGLGARRWSASPRLAMESLARVAKEIGEGILPDGPDPEGAGIIGLRLSDQLWVTEEASERRVSPSSSLGAGEGSSNGSTRCESRPSYVRADSN